MDVSCAGHLVILSEIDEVNDTRTAINFLTAVGHKSSDLRSGEFSALTFAMLYMLNWWSEMILLSDTLGVSSLVEMLNNAKPPNATSGTVLGPFFTHDAHDCTSASIHLQSGHPSTFDIMDRQCRTANPSHRRAKATTCTSKARF